MSKNGMKISQDTLFSILKFLTTFAVALLLGAIIMMVSGYNPLQVYAALFTGAFRSTLDFGTMLEKLGTILMLGLAYNLCHHVLYFNLGLEGCLYAGALAYAVIGYQFPDLSAVIYIPLCFGVAVIGGALWALPPVIFKLKYNANEACSTLMMNYVALNLTGYSIYHIWTANSYVPRTPNLLPQVTMPRLFVSSRANVTLFLAIIVFAIMLFVMFKTSFGFKIRTIGQNERFAKYAGFNVTKITIGIIALSGGIAGLAGGFEVAGMYGGFIDGIASGCTFDGLLASRLVNNNMRMIPFSSVLLALLRSGAKVVERSLGVPSAFVDLMISILILLVMFDKAFDWKRILKREKRLGAAENAGG